MALLDLVTLPVRLAVAAADTTLALGELVRADGPVRRPGGYADRLDRALAEVHRPMALVTAVATALQPGRPLGRALAPGGIVDRLMADDGPLQRLLDEDGALDRLVAADGPLERLLRTEGALDRLTRPGGALDRLLVEDGLVDRLLSQDGFLEKLISDGGTLDQLVALGTTLERIQPRIDELLALIPQLHGSVDTLSRSVGPLGDLANRIPGGRRRPALGA